MLELKVRLVVICEIDFYYIIKNILVMLSCKLFHLLDVVLCESNLCKKFLFKYIYEHQKLL